MDNLTQILITVLVGAASGAAGGYLSSKYTDKRQEKEANTREIKKFKKVASEMPDLLREMKEDLSNQGTKFIREFVISPNAEVGFGALNKCLVYYENQHELLKSKIDILENHGYLYDVSETSLQKYRFTEEFVELVHEHIKL